MENRVVKKRGEIKRIEIDRSSVPLSVGSFVKSGEATYQIVYVVNLSNVIGRNASSSEEEVLKIDSLEPVPEPSAASGVGTNEELVLIENAYWEKANKRFEAIRPLTDKPNRSRKDVVLRAQSLKMDPSTLYRWLTRYERFGTVLALVPKKRGWKKGASRISPEVEHIIKGVIEDYYLTSERHSTAKAIREVELRCRAQKIEPPSHMTVRMRIDQISERKKLQKRGFSEKARNKFAAVPGTFPNATFPLAVVEIDHHLMDIQLVSDDLRLPIGRPWLTLSIDVFSRMVTGWFLSMDSPSEYAVGQCIATSILPKEKLLEALGVEADWPVWGKPKTIHADNGSDFRSTSFMRSCENYGINLEFRPVKRPHYGGHVERFFRTLAQNVESLPGRTGSKHTSKGDDDPEKNASMTRTEFERWVVDFICNQYHLSRHSELGVPPYMQWKFGIFGGKNQPPLGMQNRIADSQTLRLDFYPSVYRVVKRTGVSLNNVTYYHDVLDPFINQTDPKGKEKIKSLFRYDIADISHIWFFCEKTRKYIQIPSFPKIKHGTSLAEYDRSRKELAAEADSHDFVEKIDLSVERNRRLVEDSQAKKKSARIEQQKSVDRKKSVVRRTVLAPISAPVGASKTAGSHFVDDSLIEPPEDVR